MTLIHLGKWVLDHITDYLRECRERLGNMVNTNHKLVTRWLNSAKQRLDFEETLKLPVYINMIQKKSQKTFT